jgi:hypothetical protein
MNYVLHRSTGCQMEGIKEVQDSEDNIQASSDSPPSSYEAAVNIPIGTQEIQVPASVTSYLQRLPVRSSAALDGTRVWAGRSKGRLVVHVGDVEVVEGEDNN